MFKTPTANLGYLTTNQHPDKRKAGGHGPTLGDEVVHLLPTPTQSDGTGGPGVSPNRTGGVNLRTAVTQDWAEFEVAVRRQEQLVAWKAPAATEIGPRGGVRLSAYFTEWLMCLPEGWVTAVPGLTRSEQIQRLGNGVVPLQAAAAFKHLMSDWPEAGE